jgi:glucose-6-phosphate dehydrogenase assembly protein OpcA
VSTPATTAAPDEAVPVRLADVERELRRQSKALQGDAEAPVQHVRMSNLVIFCQGREAAKAVAAQIPNVVKAHPARVLLLVVDSETANSEVAAVVDVRARQVSSHQMACTEQVTLHAGEAAVNRLPFAVRSLLIGDLPTNLWWASPQPPPLAGPLLYELSEPAQQIIYDSLGWTEPARGVAATAAWLEQVERDAGAGGWRVASDLNWRRLKYWRRLFSQALDPASSPGAAESITEVLIEHGPHAVIQAWEIGSWLASRLAWSVEAGRVQPGREISWRFTAPHGELRLRILRLEQGAPEIRRVRIACTLASKPAAISLALEDGRRLATVIEGSDAAARTMHVPPQTPEELIGRQLSDRERDPVFRDSMAVAQVLAQSLLE